jgi:predicted Zn finger-like uncharacterized protein
VSEKSIEPLVTECPNCGTRFRVTEGQLEIAAGKVRCGSCLEVFLGAEHFVLEDHEVELGGDANEALDALLSELAGDSTDVFGVPRESPAVADDESEQVLDVAGDLTLEPVEMEVDVPDTVAKGTDEVATYPLIDDAGDAEKPIQADAFGGLETIELVEPPEAPKQPDDVGEFADLSVEDIEFIGSAGRIDAPSVGDDADEADDADSPDDADSLQPPGAEPVAPAVDLDVPLEFHVAEPDDSEAPEEAEPVQPEAEPDPEPAIDPAEVEEIVLDEGESPHPFGWNRQAGAEVAEVPKPAGAVPDAVGALGPLNVDIEPADLEPAEPSRKRYWIPVATVVATLALVAQVFWSQRDEWSTDPSIRPIYEFSCRILPCELKPLRAVDAIYSKNLVVRQHPDVQDALIIDALVINGAPFEQPYPVIELRFSSMDGRTVAGRRFQPAEYLAGEAAGAKMIGPKTPVHISLSIKDPGSDAVNYVMLFH